jgi:hypothetical protein
MPPHFHLVRSNSPFRWDPERQVLVYDGTDDPDPNWKWNADKGGYEPVDTVDRIFDRRIGAWVFTPQTVN